MSGGRTLTGGLTRALRRASSSGTAELPLWLPKTLSAMTGPYRCAAASQNPVACCAFTQMPLPATVTVMPVTGLPGGMTVIVNG
jgi:hypothetical protein